MFTYLSQSVLEDELIVRATPITRIVVGEAICRHLHRGDLVSRQVNQGLGLSCSVLRATKSSVNGVDHVEAGDIWAREQVCDRGPRPCSIRLGLLELPRVRSLDRLTLSGLACWVVQQALTPRGALICELHSAALVIQVSARAVESLRCGALVIVEVRIEAAILRVLTLILFLIDLVNGWIVVVRVAITGTSSVMSTAWLAPVAVLVASWLARVQSFDLVQSVAIILWAWIEETSDCDRRELFWQEIVHQELPFGKRSHILYDLEAAEEFSHWNCKKNYWKEDCHDKDSHI